jgi:outer membrane protein OmpA-like peptidoglycan-associated protein
VSFDDIAKFDSIQSEQNYRLNNTFNALVSHDNEVLFNIKRKKLLSVSDEVEKKFVDFIPEHSFSVNDSLTKIIYVKKSILKYDGKNRWQLWEADLVNGKLRNEHQISMSDKKADYFYPFLTGNGRILYFASNVKGGKGGYDIYKIVKSDNKWSKTLENISEANSSFNEISPSGYADKLYFSSNRPGGLGGYDFYFSKIGSPNQNVGYPINSNADDLGLVISGNKYMFLSNKDSNLKINVFEYNPIITNLTGTIQNQLTNKPFIKLPLLIKEKGSKVNIDSVFTNENGVYNYKGKPNREYEISIQTAGIDTFFIVNTNNHLLSSNQLASLNFGLTDKIELENKKKELLIVENVNRQSFNTIVDSLKSITSNYTIIHHPFDKANVVKQDLFIYNQLIKKIKKTVNAEIIIVSAADCNGSDLYNENLSLNRAKRIHKTLFKLNKNSIKYMNVGERNLISGCELGFTFKKQQVVNRYSYIFILNQPSKS